MKLFECLIIFLLVFEVLSQRIRFLDGEGRERTGQLTSRDAKIQVCERDSTCLVWYKCPPSRLPRHRLYPPCLYEGYSKWDMGVCCTNSRSNDDIPNPIPFTTMASTRRPQIMDCGRSFPMPVSVTISRNWPWMVEFRRREVNGTEMHYCNGFLIDREHVITVAHCLHGENVGRFTLRIGNIDQRLGDVYHIKRQVIPNSYEPGHFYSDIALVTLDKPVSAPNFSPICLPEPVFRNETGKRATLVAWAGTRDILPSNYLLELQGLSIISTSRCDSIFRKRIGTSFNNTFPLGITSDFICAVLPEGGIGNCGGDSGGPLMIEEHGRWYAIGILDFGAQRCETSELPSGYTRVSSYIDFIQKNL